ncbi:MAG: hypothetical protein AAGK17_05195 [Pseudomonadota bacterium]
MTNTDPKSFNLPDGRILSEAQIDNLGRALVTLMREVVVLNDRVQVMETLLDQQGVVASEAIDTFQPDEAYKAASEAAMSKIVSSVMASLQGADGDPSQ